MRFLNRFARLAAPVGYVLVVVSVNPLNTRNLTVGLLLVLPMIVLILMEELSK